MVMPTASPDVEVTPLAPLLELEQHRPRPRGTGGWPTIPYALHRGAQNPSSGYQELRCLALQHGDLRLKHPGLRCDVGGYGAMLGNDGRAACLRLRRAEAKKKPSSCRSPARTRYLAATCAGEAYRH